MCRQAVSYGIALIIFEAWCYSPVIDEYNAFIKCCIKYCIIIYAYCLFKFTISVSFLHNKLPVGLFDIKVTLNS